MPTLTRPVWVMLIGGPLLVIAGIIATTINTASYAGSFGPQPNPMKTLPVLAYTSYVFEKPPTPNPWLFHNVQLVCQGAIILGLLVLVAGVAFQIGKSRVAAASAIAR